MLHRILRLFCNRTSKFFASCSNYLNFWRLAGASGSRRAFRPPVTNAAKSAANASIQPFAQGNFDVEVMTLAEAALFA
jgi:hypothetical protein